MTYKLIKVELGKIATIKKTEPIQSGWYWDYVTNKPWFVNDGSLGDLEYAETHYPDSISDRIIASDFYIDKNIPMWKNPSDKFKFSVVDLRKAFEAGMNYQSLFVNNLSTMGHNFGDFLKSIQEADTIEFETALIGHCNCICHNKGVVVMHVMACCYPKEVLKTICLDEQLWVNKL